MFSGVVLISFLEALATSTRHGPQGRHHLKALGDPVHARTVGRLDQQSLARRLHRSRAYRYVALPVRRIVGLIQMRFQVPKQTFDCF